MVVAGAGWQRSLAAPVTCTGVGLHLGQITQVTLLPATANSGRYFIRTDSDSGRISADILAVSQTRLSTQLGQAEGQQVRTVEHLLAALWAAGIDNARIEIDGPEVPLLDGSAQGWCELIASVGTVEQAVSRSRRELLEPVTVQEGDAYVTALPASELRFSYGIDFPVAAIGNQWHSWAPASGDFAERVAPARTFAMAHQIDGLRSQGLIKGGSLKNALVCDQNGWLNPPLRFANEPARHKLLDLVGDLSLLGVLPTMHVTAYRASHSLHVQLARQLAVVFGAETSAPA